LSRDRGDVSALNIMAWQDKVPNTTILEQCKPTGIEAILFRT